MNKTIIIGNLCHNPESKTLDSGKTVCNFDVAVNERKGEEKTATYFRCSVWGKMGEACQKYLKKGSKVGVMGTISAKAYAGNDGAPKASLNLFANEVEFLNNSNTNTNGGQTEGYSEVNAADVEMPF